MGLDFNNPTLDSMQRETCILIGVYTVAIMVLWKMPVLGVVLYPFKIMTVALHEFGHAIACVLTGGHVIEIELDLNKGGATKMRGGWRAITLPAGYLGSSLFGALMIMCGFSRLASKISCIVFAVVMLLVLYWAANWVARITTVVFIALMAGLWFIKDGEGIRFVMLFLGVMSCLYSIWDIIEDLVLRKVNESDATKYAEYCGCCPPQGWGVMWCFMSILFMLAGIFAGLVIF